MSKGALAMVLLVLIVLGGNQVIIGLFNRFSDKIILENHELAALQELKGALGKILIIDNPYLFNHEDMRASVDIAGRKLDDCRTVLSPVHKKEVWEKVESMFRSVKENVTLLINSQPENGNLQHKITLQVFDMIGDVELLIDETVQETGEYEIKSRKVKMHGTITIDVIGALLILLLAIGSFKLIRGLTQPIEQLVDATKKIAKGDRYLHVEAGSEDEFSQLADSFNTMLEALNKTSLSENYLSNILNNLDGALLVTDAAARIKTINTATARMLNYDESVLLGKEILTLFNGDHPIRSEKKTTTNLMAISNGIAKKTGMLNKAGQEIPVFVTSIVLRNGKGDPDGLVVVGHDLTEEKENEAKIEKLRKERIIAIHEAQELERLRISRDLHDGLGQLLTGISYSVEKIREDHVIDHEVAKQLQKQINNAIQETKSIARDLTPNVLRDFGLTAAIETLIQRANMLSKVRFFFNSYSFTERIEAALEKTIFRICQEAVNNIIKHSGANKATIELYRVEDMIVLAAEDNGKGFDLDILDQTKKPKGLGLISMVERVHAFDGDISINSDLDSGTEIVIEVPFRIRKNNGDN